MSNNDFKEDKEIWRPIKDYEGYYEVSTAGNVRSLDRTVRTKFNNVRGCEGKILKKLKDRNGYYYVDLSKNQHKKKKKIHRLVAQTFIPNAENKSQVNHKNGIKTDNSVENLEWCSDAENKQHAFRTGLNPIGAKRTRAKLTNEQIKEIRKKYIFGSKEFGIKPLAEKYSVSKSTIYRVIKYIVYKE